MADFTEKFEYVDFWPRVAVALLDCFIFYWPLSLVTWWINTFDLSVRWLTPLPFFLESLLVSVIPPLIFVVRWGGTPGKLILKMRIVDRGARYLGVSRAIRREALNYLYVAVQWVQLALFIRRMGHKLVSASTDEISQAYLDYLGPWGLGLPLLFIVVLSLIDVLVVAFNRRKRALHDFLAGSYVITKRSYDAIHCPAPAPTAAPTNELPESGLA